MATNRNISLIAAVSTALLFAGDCKVSFYSALAREGPAPFTTFPTAQIPHLMDEKYFVVRFTSVIPQDCRKALSKQAARMAEPGEEFQETDFIVKEGLPWCRLIFAGEQAKGCFVHYECGGRGHSYRLLFAGAHDAQGNIPVWRGFGSGAAKDIQQLRGEFMKGEFSADSEFQYTH